MYASNRMESRIVCAKNIPFVGWNADEWLHYVSTGEKPWISIEGPR